MSFETELNIALTAFLRPIVAQCVKEAVQQIGPLASTAPASPDNEPYGDFHWLRGTCPGVPASTLRIKSAAGEIPGTVKFGKRVLYEKVQVLDWLRSKTRQLAPDVAEVERAAEEQVSGRLTQRATRRKSANPQPRKAA